jgi:4-hydroxy-4-methyl-2-oxoglutarate aldolase
VNEPAAVEALRRLAEEAEGPSCVVSDALGRSGGLRSEVRPMWAGAGCVGTAVTAKPHGSDLSAVFQAIDLAGEGDVIVIEGQGAGPFAFWGENASLLALRRGIAGTVLGAPCRDVAAHARLGYPVFAVGATPTGGVFGERGAVQVPVTLGGVVVAPGDVVVGDENGVVVVPAARLSEVVDAVPELLARERAIQDDIAAGRGLSLRRP